MDYKQLTNKYKEKDLLTIEDYIIYFVDTEISPEAFEGLLGFLSIYEQLGGKYDNLEDLNKMRKRGSLLTLNGFKMALIKDNYELLRKVYIYNRLRTRQEWINNLEHTRKRNFVQEPKVYKLQDTVKEYITEKIINGT